MPKASINREMALRAICTEVGGDFNQLQSNYEQLDQLIRDRHVNWNRAAQALGISRDKLYHWYRDTFKRQNQRYMEAKDKVLIERMICQRLDLGLPLDNAYKYRYYFSYYQGVYDYYIFSVVFNNARYKARRNRCNESLSVPSCDFDLLTALKNIYTEQPAPER